MADLEEHFQVVAGSGRQALSLEQLAFLSELGQPLLQLGPDSLHRFANALVRRDEMLGRVDVELF